MPISHISAQLATRPPLFRYSSVNAKGELVNVAVTAGNVDDRAPVPKLSKRLSGLLCGDKGYISRDLFAMLRSKGIKLITGMKKGMQSFPMNLCEKIILRKRSLVESVIGYLKNTMQLEHTRHRSVIGAFIHIASALVMYQMKTSKPSLKFTCSLALYIRNTVAVMISGNSRRKALA